MTSLALGIMSGTSLDGVDVGLVRIHSERSVELCGFASQSYVPSDRRLIREAIVDGGAPKLAALDVLLAERFAEAARTLCDRASVDIDSLDVVGSHGQTIWHIPGTASLQVGNASVLAERLGVRVVSDFRSADIAAGGQGAPLVPMADAMLFASDTPRILLNIGGMANATWVRQAGALDDLVAFDTGPGVAIIDGMTHLVDPNVEYDHDGERALRGSADRDAVKWALSHSYFDSPPPKSTGREVFGEPFVRELQARANGSHDDAVATAVVVVAESIAMQIQRWVPAAEELAVSGGGARNPVLMDALRAELGSFSVRSFSDLFFDGDAKEAVAFAYLAWRTTRGLAGNVPAATGARGPRVLGLVTG